MGFRKGEVEAFWTRALGQMGRGPCCPQWCSHARVAQALGEPTESHTHSTHTPTRCMIPGPAHHTRGSNSSLMTPSHVTHTRNVA